MVMIKIYRYENYSIFNKIHPDSENEIYIPETILPLDAVYQNARLIAKPDESGLNPETIL